MCPLESWKPVSSTSFYCNTAHFYLFIFPVERVWKRTWISKKHTLPLSEVVLSLCDRVSLCVTNNMFNCIQLYLNTCDPKQWSPSHQQPSEVQFPSPRNEETRTLMLSPLESTHLNLPLHCLPTSTTACQQITLTQVFYGYLLVNVTIERGVKMVGRSVSFWFPNKCLMLWDWLSRFSTLLLFKDPAQSLASDFGFEDNFNHALKVEEKKNHQNRIVASREPPPVPPLPPRKTSYNASNSQPPPPVPKERVVSLHTNSLTTSSKPESVNNWAQIFSFNEKTEITDLAFSQEIPNIISLECVN